METRELAWIFFCIGVLLLVFSLTFYMNTQGFQGIEENLTLLPFHVVQLESDKVNGSLVIPLNVTVEGHVDAAVAGTHDSYAFTQYEWYLVNSSNGQSYFYPESVMPGKYYLIQNFTIPDTSHSGYYLAIGIYETILKANPKFPYAIGCLISGATLIALWGCLLLRGRQVAKANALNS
jgi:hypothetical protein